MSTPRLIKMLGARGGEMCILRSPGCKLLLNTIRSVRFAPIPVPPAHPDGLEEDDLGIELPDVEHAYLEAYRAIPETVVDLMRQGVGGRDHAFVIADAGGRC